jgi:hypothetical protein
MRKSLVVLLYLFLVGCPVNIAFSQISHSNRSNLTGRLIDIETGKGIAFAQILNESLRIATISDTSGRYIIRGKVGDTLVFSVLGYLGKYIVINNMNEGEILVTKLAPRNYDIAEVRVFGYSSYSQFKREFQHIKIPKTETDKLRDNLQQIALDIGKEARYQLAMEKAARGGNLASFSILSPEEIQRLKLKEIIKKERVQDAIDKKFNRQIVADLTGLKDRELDDFMLFCNFDTAFLIKTDQYDILLKVLEKLEAFKQIKKNTGTIQNSIHYACDTFLSGYSESPSQN